jgi:hypothetical protein
MDKSKIVAVMDAIQSFLGLGKALVYGATTEARKQQKEERDKKIIGLYLKAENTMDGVAELVNVTKKTVDNVIDNLCKNSTDEKITQNSNFEPFLYNIWNTPKQDNERKHFGAFPEIFLENLIRFLIFGGNFLVMPVQVGQFLVFWDKERKLLHDNYKKLLRITCYGWLFICVESC